MPETLNPVQTRKQDNQETEYTEDDIKKMHSFYTVKTDSQGNFKGLHIKKAAIADKIKEFNIYCFVDGVIEVSRYVKIKNNLIKEVNKDDITVYFLNFILNLPNYDHFYSYKVKSEVYETSITITPKMIRDTLFEKLGDYFSKTILNTIRPNNPIEIKMDSKREKFFYYQNGFVTVTKDGFEFKEYKELKGNIWENQKLKRDFNYNLEIGTFEKFIYRICGHKEKHFKNLDAKTKKRVQSLKTLIGYALHNHFNRNLFAIILTDSKVSEDDELNGRTGKTLLCQSLGWILNYNTSSNVYCEIAGIDFDPTKDFKYQKASLETQLIHINDLNRNTKFEVFRSDITEGITCNKKNEKPFPIRAKMIISSNKTLSINGSTEKARARFFELSDWYNENFSPSDEFNEWLFDEEWPEVQWNCFDSFIVSCCVEYFKHGVIEADKITLDERMLRDHTKPQFVDFMNDFIKTGKCTYSDMMNSTKEIEFIYDMPIVKASIYNAFVQCYPDFRNLKQNTFTKWLREYCAHSDCIQKLSRDAGTEYRSNSQDYVIFKPINNDK